MAATATLFVIRSRIGTRERNVIVNEDMMKDCSKFIIEALRIHGIETTEQIDVQLFDNHRAPVDKNTFPLLVRQFNQSDNFYIEVDVTGNTKTALLTENLGNCLKGKECSTIFAEEKRNGFLSEKSRRLLLKNTLEFLLTEYDDSPTSENIIDVSKALLTLFESLKMTPSTIGGIDLLYDPQKRKGEMYEKLVYHQRKMVSLRSHEQRKETTGNLMENDDIIEIFNNIKLPEERNRLVEMLQKTAEQRMRDLKSNKTIMKAGFVCYMVAPELILIDFEFLHPGINGESLKRSWHQIQKKPFEFHKTELDQSKLCYHTDDNHHDFLTFLNVLPTHRTKFENSVNSMFIFLDDPNQDLTAYCKYNDVQKIIIIDSNDETSYYILVQGSLMKVPSAWIFIDVIDVFFKIHKVFNLNFHKAIMQPMLFFECYIYGMKQEWANLSVNTKRVANNLLPSFN